MVGNVLSHPHSRAGFTVHSRKTSQRFFCNWVQYTVHYCETPLKSLHFRNTNRCNITSAVFNTQLRRIDNTAARIWNEQVSHPHHFKMYLFTPYVDVHTAPFLIKHITGSSCFYSDEIIVRSMCAMHGAEYAVVQFAVCRWEGRRGGGGWGVSHPDLSHAEQTLRAVQ